MITEKDVKIVNPVPDYLNVTANTLSTSGISICVEFTNYTKKPIYLKTQTNVPICIEPAAHTIARDPHPHIEITTTYSIKSNENFLKTKELMDSIVINEKVLSAEARNFYNKMLQAIELEPRVAYHRTFRFAAVRKIRDAELANNRSIYLRENDIVASYNKAEILRPHPNSNESFQQVEVETNQSYQGYAGVFIRVIDNDMLVPCWYFYAGKQLIEIPPVYDETKESGVYVTTSTKNEGHALKIDTEFMSFKDAEARLGVYKTREEAQTYGNPSELIKLEEARLKNAERELQAEVISLKQESERNAAAAERELSMLRHNNAILKESLDVRSKERSDYYEAMGLNRKDVHDKREKKRKEKYEEKSAKIKWLSEAVKYIPGLIIGGIGIYAATRKNS